MNPQDLKTCARKNNGIKTLLLLLIMIFTPNISCADNIVIEEGTEVLIKVTDRLKSGAADSREGSVVCFIVDKAVKNKEGFILIEDGAKAYGTITKSRSAGMFGASGALEISIDRVYSYNDKEIPLRGIKGSKGASSTGTVIAGAIFRSPFAVIFNFRGYNAVVESGTIFRAYVDKTTVLLDVPPLQLQPASQTQLVEEYLGIVILSEKTKEGGFAILEVIPGGLAEFAGIQKYDALVILDTFNLKEHDIERVSAYIDMRIKQKAIIKATVLRGKNTKVIEIQL